MGVSFKKTKRFGVLLDVTLKLIKQDLIKRFKDNQLDLTPEQWTLLAELAEKGTIYQRELAKNTFKDAPTVSRIIELIRQRGYITRKADKTDRRRFLISLTKQGQAVYDKAAPLVYEARKNGWEGLTDQDFEDLNRILDKVASNIQGA